VLNNNLYPVLISIVLLVSGCNAFVESNKNNDILARAFGYELWLHDIEGIVPEGSSDADSVEVVKSFVENWVRQKIVLNKAEKNLPDSQKDFEKQLLEYRNSLIIFNYEQELIRQKLDTLVSDREIEQFYNDNKSNFELKDNIIKVIYLKLRVNTPKIDKVKQWYRSNNPKDKQLLEDYCYQYALNYYLDESTWLLFDDLLKEVPISMYDKEQFLRNNRFVELQDSASIYLVNIKGFQTKSSLSPLSFEKENIRNMILNQRKLKLIHEMEQNAYRDAARKSQFEVFIK
jgi:hypothetical protein